MDGWKVEKLMAIIVFVTRVDAQQYPPKTGPLGLTITRTSTLGPNFYPFPHRLFFFFFGRASLLKQGRPFFSCVIIIIIL